jgi:hypothetical protein
MLRTGSGISLNFLMCSGITETKSQNLPGGSTH